MLTALSQGDYPANTYQEQYNGLFQKKFKKSGKSGVEDIDFPGVKKKHVEILGLNLKRSRIYRYVLKKFPWVLVLLTSRGVTQFFRTSRGQSLFLRVKWQI